MQLALCWPSSLTLFSTFSFSLDNLRHLQQQQVGALLVADLFLVIDLLAAASATVGAARHRRWPGRHGRHRSNADAATTAKYFWIGCGGRAGSIIFGPDCTFFLNTASDIHFADGYESSVSSIPVTKSRSCRVLMPVSTLMPKAVRPIRSTSC